MTRVLTFGEALATLDASSLLRVDPRGDVAAPPALDVHVAGAELNTAVGLARLGLDVSWFSRVADDAFGALVRSTLDREGIDGSRIASAPGEKTGLIVTSRLDDHAVRSEHYRIGSAASHLSADTVGAALRDALLDGVGLVHATGITPALGEGPRSFSRALVAEAADRGVRISFDVNHRPQLADDERMREIVGELLPSVDVLFCNEAEAELLTGRADPAEALEILAARGPRTVVVKLGRRGVIARVDGRMLDAGSWPVPLPTFPVGAGDSFNAAWLALELQGVAPEIALPLSSWVASRVVAHPADHDGFPALDEVQGIRNRLEHGELTAPTLMNDLEEAPL